MALYTAFLNAGDPSYCRTIHQPPARHTCVLRADAKLRKESKQTLETKAGWELLGVADGNRKDPVSICIYGCFRK